MPKPNSVQIYCHTSPKGYYLLSVFNVHLNAFLSLFKENMVTKLRIFWIDGEKDMMSSLQHPIQAGTFDFRFEGIDIQILTVEVELDNGFIIDSNLMDELFCRVTPSYPIEDLEDKIRKLDAEALIHNEAPMSMNTLPSESWVTAILDE